MALQLFLTLPVRPCSYMVASGLFDRSNSRAETKAVSDPLVVGGTHCSSTTAAESPSQHKPEDSLGGFDPDHASKLLSFAKAMMAAAAQLSTPLGGPVRMRVGLHW